MAVQIYLITGFLGSGKTLFLQRLLERKISGQRIAIVLNDFGETVFDSYLLAKSATNLVEVPGGCLCCSAIDDFQIALSDILATSPTHIFIEATGLADALQVRADLAFMNFPVHATLCTVDSLNFENSLARFSAVREQVESADVLLLTKSDLAPADSSEKLTKILSSLNRRAPVISLRQGALPEEFRVALFSHSDHFIEQKSVSQHLFHDAITAFKIVIPHRLEYEILARILDSLPQGVVRIKGKISMVKDEVSVLSQFFPDSGSFFLLNFVCGRWDCTPITEEIPENSEISTLFVIGTHLHLEEITACFLLFPSAEISVGSVHSRGILD